MASLLREIRTTALDLRDVYYSETLMLLVTKGLLEVLLYRDAEATRQVFEALENCLYLVEGDSGLEEFGVLAGKVSTWLAS